MIYSCKNCSDRYPCCHDTCEKYITEKAEHLRNKNAYYADMQISTYMNDSIAKNIRRANNKQYKHYRINKRRRRK